MLLFLSSPSALKAVLQRSRAYLLSQGFQPQWLVEIRLSYRKSLLVSWVENLGSYGIPAQNPMLLEGYGISVYSYNMACFQGQFSFIQMLLPSCLPCSFTDSTVTIEFTGTEPFQDQCLRKSQAGLKADWLFSSAQILPLTKPRLWNVSCRHITEFRAIWTLKYCLDFCLLSHNFLTMLSSSTAFFCWQAVLCLLEWWKAKALNGIINMWQFLSFLIKYMTANGPVLYLNKPHSQNKGRRHSWAQGLIHSGYPTDTTEKLIHSEL